MAARGEALVLKLDVTDQGQIKAAIKAAEEKFGCIDVLVNNAGIGCFAAAGLNHNAENTPWSLKKATSPPRDLAKSWSKPRPAAFATRMFMRGVETGR